MAQRFQVLVVAVAAALSLLFSAGFASAEERAFMTIRGQRSGVIKGDCTFAEYPNQFQLQSFSVSPATPGSGPVTLSGTVSYFGLAYFFNSLVNNENMPEVVIKTDKLDVYTQSMHKSDYQVTLINSYFTDLSFDLTAGGPDVISFKLTTSPAGAIHYTDAATGAALTTAIPGIAAPTATIHSGATIKADKLKTSVGGDITTPIQEMALHITAPGNGAGKATLSSMTFTHLPDASSDAIKAAASRGDSLAGTNLVYSIPVTATGSVAGPTTLRFRITLGAAKFAVLPAGSVVRVATGSAPGPIPDKYTVLFGAPPAGSYDVTVYRYEGGVTAAY